MTIGKKLVIAVGAMFLMAGALGYSGLSSNSTFKNLFDEVVDKTNRKSELAGAVTAATAEMFVAQRGVILAAYLKDPVEVETNRSKFQKADDALRNALAELKNLANRDDVKKLADAVAGLEAEWLPHYQDLVRQCEAGNPDEANRIRKETTRFLDPMTESGRQIVAIMNEVLQADRVSAEAAFSRNRWIAIVLLLVTLAAGAVVAFVVLKTTRELRTTARELLSGAEQVAGAASQITASSQTLAQGSSEQAASLQEISSSSTEINSMAGKNGENSRVAAERVAQSEARFVETNRSLEQMVGAIGEISSHSEKISKIIRVIDEIAFQTNILALNAAVEAARAGEAGMGFAVVADEVRNLAQRSATAAKDTAALIEEQVAKSSGGKNKVDQVAAAIHAITGESAEVKQLVEEVSLGSQEQARGIEQVSKAISQMEQVTQQNAAGAEQSAAAAEELSAQSSALKDLAERLASMVGRAEVARVATPVSRSNRDAPGPRQPPARFAGRSVHTAAREAFPLGDAEANADANDGF